MKALSVCEAREKQDDEALKELTDHLEASSAIVAAQTRDWVHFQEENQVSFSRRSKSFMVSSNDVGETPLPYLANYSEDSVIIFIYDLYIHIYYVICSILDMLYMLLLYLEDPHLAFKLVMHVPPDGAERSLGADVGCDFRLPPGLGVLATIGSIRNTQGRLVLRCAPGKPSAIEAGRKNVKEILLRRWSLLLL